MRRDSQIGSDPLAEYSHTTMDDQGIETTISGSEMMQFQ